MKNFQNEVKKLRWGFVGTGKIAQRIMVAFELVPEAEVVAAYSRNIKAMQEFCDQWEIPKRYETVEELVNDPEVDIVYLATPHIVHYEHTIKALQAGKHVLCEKPIAMSAQETQGMVDLAREKGVFLMEALWSRFFPISVWLRELIASGKMGKVSNVMADFSYQAEYDPEYRFFKKELGGGAMRGAGIYPLSMAAMVFGEIPCEIKAMAETRNGVDLRSSALLRFPCGGTAQIYTGFQSESVWAANIAFEKGAVYIPNFWHPDRAYIIRDGEAVETVEMPFTFPGFQFEIIETMKCIQAGRTECSVMPLEESIALAGVMDEMYRQWNVE